MNDSSCPTGALIRDYLDRRGERPEPAAVEGDAELKALILHMADCAPCRQAYQREAARLQQEAKLDEEAETWAAVSGSRAAVTVAVRSGLHEDVVHTAEIEAAEAREGTTGRIVREAEAWLADLVNRARAFRLNLEMPSELVFVGARGDATAYAPQQYLVEHEALARGGWDPCATLWITPKEIFVQLTPAFETTAHKTPRFAIRSVSGGFLWLDDPRKPEQLPDGSHLVLAGRLDDGRPVHAQVQLPLDIFAWYVEE